MKRFALAYSVMLLALTCQSAFSQTSIYPNAADMGQVQFRTNQFLMDLNLVKRTAESYSRGGQMEKVAFGELTELRWAGEAFRDAVRTYFRAPQYTVDSYWDLDRAYHKAKDKFPHLTAYAQEFEVFSRLERSLEDIGEYYTNDLRWNHYEVRRLTDELFRKVSFTFRAAEAEASRRGVRTQYHAVNALSRFQTAVQYLSYRLREPASSPRSSQREFNEVMYRYRTAYGYVARAKFTHRVVRPMQDAQRLVMRLSTYYNTRPVIRPRPPRRPGGPIVHPRRPGRPVRPGVPRRPRAPTPLPRIRRHQ